MTNPAKDVLIVEDDDSIRNLVALAHAREGLTCDTAEDGVYAVEHLTEKRYSVLLRPIVLEMTAGAQVEPLQPFAEIVHAVINKPFDVAELRDLVKGCVTSRQRNDGLEGVQQ